MLELIANALRLCQIYFLVGRGHVFFKHFMADANAWLQNFVCHQVFVVGVGKFEFNHFWVDFVQMSIFSSIILNFKERRLKLSNVNSC